MEQFVEFKLGGENFCVDINRVKYIEKFQDITHMPKIPKYIEGIINIHDEVIAVYNLHQKFALNQVNVTDDSIFIIVSVGDIGVALIVDKVYQIIDNQKYELDPTPKMILGNNRYISGVLKADDRLIMVLDIDEIVDEQEQQDISDMLNAEEQEELINV